MLSDRQIKHALRWQGLEISGFNTVALQAASYDVRLDPQLLVLRDGEALDPKCDTTLEWTEVEMGPQGYTLALGDFVLGSTIERVCMGEQLVGQLEGKSSLGRLGLMVHSTAGFLDPGFTGQVTLELACVHRRGITIYPGMPIGQVAFSMCASVEKTYQGKYLNQRGPTVSRYHLNWDGRSWGGR